VTSESPTLDLGSPTVVAGGIVSGSLRGFVPGETAAVDFAGTPLFSGIVDQFGRASFSATILPGTSPGLAMVTATGATSGRVATRGLTVTAPAALAETGADIVPAGLPGALLLAAGAITIVARRRYARVR
jgi:5'-nucleotidase